MGDTRKKVPLSPLGEQILPIFVGQLHQRELLTEPQVLTRAVNLGLMVMATTIVLPDHHHDIVANELRRIHRELGAYLAKLDGVPPHHPPAAPNTTTETQIEPDTALFQQAAADLSMFGVSSFDDE